MRRAARVDSNQEQITKALRHCGATVQHLHSVGNGCPDILVGFRGANWLFEIKSPGHEMALTSEQVVWHREWVGTVWVVTSPEQAIDLLLGTNRGGSLA